MWYYVVEVRKDFLGLDWSRLSCGCLKHTCGVRVGDRMLCHLCR